MTRIVSENESFHGDGQRETEAQSSRRTDGRVARDASPSVRSRHYQKSRDIRKTIEVVA